ncbi:MAG: hypothetical protein WA055_00440 [Candidatus Moraniibacteriota bacterium]
MKNVNKALDDAIGQMTEGILKRCQPLYRGQLEMELPNSSNKSEFYVYIEEEGYPREQLKSIMVEVAIIKGILRRKIFSISRDLNDFGIRWVRIFDKKIVSIIEEEIEKLQAKLPSFEVEIKEYPQNFFDQH